MAVEYQVKYTPGFDPTIVNVSQNDVGRQFDLKIIDETGAAQQIPSGSTVKFVGMKPSGLGFTVNCTFTNSVVHVTTTDIMTDEHGLIPAEVQITKGNTVIGTANVNLRVEKNPHPEGTIDDNIIRVIPTFNAIFQRLNTLESSMSTAQNNISNLQTRMTTAEGTLSNVAGEVEQQSGAITNIGTELGGIRTGYDGTVYQTAGDAVRAQAFRGTDTTLSVEGKAADAKATGDAFSDIDKGSIFINKTLTWQNGYVNNSGRIIASTVSAFALVKMYAGERVHIGTANSNICIIGSTTASSVSVGDTVSVIQNTTSSGSFEEYYYTAQSEISLVLCVKRSNYVCSFSKKIEFLGTIDRKINGANSGYQFGYIASRGTFRAEGIYNDSFSNRLRTNFIPFKAYDRIVIENGNFQHVCGMWKGTLSSATITRNDGAWVTTNETVVPDYDGYIIVVFRKSDNSTLQINDFDGTITLYNTLAFRNSVYINQALTIPEYYFENEYLQNKAARINALGKTGDDVFCFITDIHWERNARHSYELLNYLNQNCAIHKTFNGGDVADASKLHVYKKYRASIDGDTFHVAGNHDWFAPTTGRDLYYCMDSKNNCQVGNPFMHFWYTDNVQQHIRYIVLNSFTRAEGSSTVSAGYDTDQINWFNSTALDVPNDWDVIVFTHILRTTTVAVTGGTAIENAIGTFNADVERTGKILAVFQGHTHWDAIYHTSTGVPVITTTCDKYDLSNEPELAQSVRVKGTTSEQAFDIVILNRAEKTITLVRIGALAQNNVDKYRTDPGFEWVGTLEERTVSYASE